MTITFSTPALWPALISLTLLPGLASAEPAKWSGEGVAGGGFSAGNTETADLGLALQLARESGPWAVEFNASADFSETDGVQTENRLFFDASLDRQLFNRAFLFGSVNWEQDAFSGFSSRTFIGGGLGYELVDAAQTKWSVRAGPGVKQDRIRAQTRPDPSQNVAGRTVDSFSIIGRSDLRHAVNDGVTLTNDSSGVWAETSTQFRNESALTAALTDALSARVSFEVRYDTDPPIGTKSTDTVTRFSIVYGFGK